MKMDMDKMLGMSDEDFMKNEPTILDQVISGEHFELMVNLPNDQLRQVAESIGAKNASVKELKRAVKELDGQDYSSYVSMVTSFSKEK